MKRRRDRRLGEAPLLAQPERSVIAAPENTIFVSAVSHWEIWLKVGLGKLRVPGDFAQRLEEEAFEALLLAARHTQYIASAPWHHRDPFDRILVAQAATEGLFFLTSDGARAAYGDHVLLK